MSRIQNIRRLFGCGSSMGFDAEFKPKHDPKNGQFTSGSGGSASKKGPLSRIKRVQQAERGYSGRLSEKELAAAEKVNRQETAKAEKKAEAKKLKEASNSKKEAKPKAEKAPAKKKTTSKRSGKAVSSEAATKPKKDKAKMSGAPKTYDEIRPYLKGIGKAKLVRVYEEYMGWKPQSSASITKMIEAIIYRFSLDTRQENRGHAIVHGPDTGHNAEGRILKELNDAIARVSD